MTEDTDTAVSAVNPPSVPLFEKAVLFAHHLRHHGIAVAPEQAGDFARALRWIDLGSRRQVLAVARAILVTRREDLPLFEACFDRFWGGKQAARPRKAPPAPRTEGGEHRRPALASFLAERAHRDAPEVELADRSGTASDLEVLLHKDFARMGVDELRAVRRLIEDLDLSIVERPSRRRVRSDRGDRLDARRLLRGAARHAGVVLELPRSRRKVRPRPLVMIADISGSMERSTRIALLFLHTLTRQVRNAESFVFGTRLTRITERIRLRDVDAALDAVADEVFDWAGGTRIGTSLARFNRRWARRVLRRGAVVLIVSDGCERGDVDTLATELRALRDRCHRLIWLNPRLGHDQYQPLAAGMAAALPLVDDFLPIHNLQSLGQLAEHLRQLPRRRSARRTTRTQPGGVPASRIRTAGRTETPIEPRSSSASSAP